VLRVIARVRLLAISLMLIMALDACGLGGSGTFPPHAGTLPPPGPDGQLDPSDVPDFVAVAGRNGGIAGYVRKEAVFDTSDRAWPVFAPDLRTVIGQLVPGRGFVPGGVDPSAVPTFPVFAGSPDSLATSSAGTQAVFVRNASPRAIWLAVRVFSDGVVTYQDAAQYWGDGFIGAGCFTMPIGSDLVLLYESPADRGGAGIRLVLAQSYPEPAARYIEIADDGTALTGIGRPPWWNGATPC